MRSRAWRCPLRKQTQSLKLVIEGHEVVTVTQGETPVIPLFSTDMDFCGPQVAMAINFLRSGSSMVQLFHPALTLDALEMVAESLKKMIDPLMPIIEEGPWRLPIIIGSEDGMAITIMLRKNSELFETYEFGDVYDPDGTKDFNRCPACGRVGTSAGYRRRTCEKNHIWYISPVDRVIRGIVD